jgi:hypothetical protein
MLGSPASVSVSSDTLTGGGSVFIADSQFNNIRRLFFNGTITTVLHYLCGDTRPVCLS